MLERIEAKLAKSLKDLRIELAYLMEQLIYSEAK